MAKEHGLPPMLRAADGTWGPAHLSGEELADFRKVREDAERNSVLVGALVAKIAEESATRLALPKLVSLKRSGKKFFAVASRYDLLSREKLSKALQVHDGRVVETQAWGNKGMKTYKVTRGGKLIGKKRRRLFERCLVVRVTDDGDDNKPKSKSAMLDMTTKSST